MREATIDRILLIGILAALACIVVTITAHADNAVQTIEMSRVDLRILSAV